MADLANRRTPPVRIIDLVAVTVGLFAIGLLIEGTINELGRVQAVWVIVLAVASATVGIWAGQVRLLEKLQMKQLEMLCNLSVLPRQGASSNGSSNGSVHHLNRSS